MSLLKSIYVHRDRLAGGLQGLLIGDALGVPYASHDALALPQLADIDMTPPVGFARSHADVPPGTWSDDGAQALCLLASLLACGELDLRDFSGRLLDWALKGYMAVDGRVLDMDNHARVAIDRLRDGADPAHASFHNEQGNGNGALIRALPLALWHQGSDASLIEMATHQALPTQDHIQSGVACAMLCLWARAELREEASPWAWARTRLREEGPSAGLPDEVIASVLDEAQGHDPGHAGYAVDTLWSVRTAIEASTDYAGAVHRAIALGKNTDAASAITGGLAGIRYGLYGIPLSWRESLRGQSLFIDLQRELLASAGRREGARIVVTRTSLSHPLQIGTLLVPSGGRIGITFCPGKKQLHSETGAWDRDLITDLYALRDWGASHLITLLAPWEFQELGVVDLPYQAGQAGLQWHAAPILDGLIPGVVPPGYDPGTWFQGVWGTILTKVSGVLDQGGGVVVHCKGGLGRAGTVASLLLAERYPELSASRVIQAVREVRPNAIETVIQERYLGRMIDARDWS